MSRLPAAFAYHVVLEDCMTQRSRTRQSAIGLAAVAVAVLLSATPLRAHHGWGGYESRDSELSGILDAPVSTAGPHATMKVRVGDKVWDVVLAPPARTIAAGLKEGVIPVGAEVKVHGHKHRDAKKLEIKTERVTWNGRVFNVYPDRT
jgi:hypothetical protein